MSSNKIVSKQRRRLPQHPSCRFPLALATCIFEIRDGCSFPSPPWAGAMRPRLPQDFRRKPETQNKTESPDVDLEKEQKSHAGKQKSNTYKTSSRPTTNAKKCQQAAIVGPTPNRKKHAAKQRSCFANAAPCP